MVSGRMACIITNVGLEFIVKLPSLEFTELLNVCVTVGLLNSR